ncbi:DUF2634 domain-containing protein [Heyndrickxia sp. NPDC080065]|uniref:DUF2634 domain-containing protein n=1 Tax=Heyndrickxia sp. NPDC080065 TaxID=3390568 RepID=UPI003CFDCD5B
MALSPEVDVEELDSVEIIPILKTFRYDFERNRLTSEIIDRLEAAKQIIMFALKIQRYAYPIFSSDVGNEIEEMLSDNETTIEYKKMELPRLITEALIYLDFVEEVSEFEIEHEDDSFYVNFIVETTVGTIEIEEVY